MRRALGGPPGAAAGRRLVLHKASAN